MKNSYYKKGTYNAICDRCGYKYKADGMRLTWDNLFVCNDCWEPRQPQDFVRSRRDSQRVPIARPEGEDTFLAAPLQPGDLP